MNPRPMMLAFALGIGISVSAQADDSVSLCNEAQWKQATATAEQVAVGRHGLTLQQAPVGHWTSKWLNAPDGDSWKSAAVETQIDLFANKTIEMVVDGSTKPFVDADGVEHDWYGRCMIAILDAQRWVMAIRSGINHVQWGKRDAIHVLTSGDEGRTWSSLNHWFDGTPIEGLPYEDGHTHSEPGLYRMPNGEWSSQFRGHINRPRPGAAKPPSAGSSAPLGHYGFQGAIARLRRLDQAMADDEIHEAYRTACESFPAVDRRPQDGCGVAKE